MATGHGIFEELGEMSEFEWLRAATGGYGWRYTDHTNRSVRRCSIGRIKPPAWCMILYDGPQYDWLEIIK